MSRIHIFGASGSGTSTLGRELAARLGCPHLDTDKYFWLPTDPPFRKTRETGERLAMLMDDLQHEEWVLSGSLCGWGDPCIPLFDLAVYLWIPHDLRMSRLAAREIERYGKDAVGSESSRKFLDWAAQYDNGGLDVRSRALHEAWMANLPCSLIKLEGDLSVDEQVAQVLLALRAKPVSSPPARASIRRGRR